MSDIGRRTVRHAEQLTALQCLPLGIAQLVIGNQNSLLTATAGILTFFAAMRGDNRTLMFLVGTTTIASVALYGPIPLGGVVPAAALAGGTIRRLRKHYPEQVMLIRSAFASLAIVAYWLASPPVSNAGQPAAYALFFLALVTSILSVAICKGTAGISDIYWGVLGITFAVGRGLVEAYSQISSNYEHYRLARDFVSSIGQSNLAAGIAVTTGIALLTLAVNSAGAVKLIFFIVSAPFLATPLILGSRGALVAAFAGVGALLIQSRVRRGGASSHRLVRPAIVAGTAASLGFAIFVAKATNAYIWQRLTTTNPYGAGYDSGRRPLWNFTIDAIFDHPLIGLGPGNLASYLLERSNSAYSHVFFLDIFAQLGIFGGLVYLWSFAMWGSRGWSYAAPAIATLLTDSMLEPNITTAIGAPIAVALYAMHRHQVLSLDWHPIKTAGARDTANRPIPRASAPESE